MGQKIAETGWGHTSVLLQEVIAGLAIAPGDIFLDATLGSGGHSEAVLEQFGSAVQVIGLDADASAVQRSQGRLSHYSGTTQFAVENFRNLDRALDHLGVKEVSKILFDLGLSSNQLEESGRGFSFKKDEPLTMTFAEYPGANTVTATTILNDWSEDSIATIIWGYGGERYARRIASRIIQARARLPITTTTELVNIILEATPRAYHHRPIHPATRTFQALRIAANDELKSLEEGLAKGFEKLTSQGRIAVISFHSLEDRIVKNFFKVKEKARQAKIITKKPIVPTKNEHTENRRSRSAKLRILMKS